MKRLLSSLETEDSIMHRQKGMFISPVYMTNPQCDDTSSAYFDHESTRLEANLTSSFISDDTMIYNDNSNDSRYSIDDHDVIAERNMEVSIYPPTKKNIYKYFNKIQDINSKRPISLSTNKHSVSHHITNSHRLHQKTLNSELQTIDYTCTSTTNNAEDNVDEDITCHICLKKTTIDDMSTNLIMSMKRCSFCIRFYCTHDCGNSCFDCQNEFCKFCIATSFDRSYDCVLCLDCNK